MKFLTVTDEAEVKHKILVISLSETEMSEVAGQCAKCMPSVSVSSLMQLGHPYVIVDFGGGDAFKTAIPLDEASEDGHKVGSELEVGDVLTVILTSKPNAIRVSKDRVYMEVPWEEILAFSFLFTAEMAENYAFYSIYKMPKGE